MTAMNRSGPVALQLGEGPELQGFGGAPGSAVGQGHRQRKSRGRRSPCLKRELESRRGTYVVVVVEQLAGRRAGGRRPLGGVAAARVSVLVLKFFQLQENKKTKHDLFGARCNLSVLVVPEPRQHIQCCYKRS